MMEVAKGDPINARGLRNVTDGDLGLLESFEFNEKKMLKVILGVDYSANIDRASGSMKIEIPSFIPREKLVPAPGATHFKILSAGAEIDFDKGWFLVDVQNSQ